MVFFSTINEMQTKNFPKISIITVSYNQAELLEDTILSVLSQDYPNLEYVIIDNGSTDGSIDIIKKYSDRLKFWTSEPDEKRSDAIDKGFKHSSGEIMAWLDCGDLYFPWTLSLVKEIFAAFPEIEWLTSGIICSWLTKSLPYFYEQRNGYTKSGFFDGRNLPRRKAIQRESTFWRRSLWQKTGGYINKKFWLAYDFELWSRFWEQGPLYTLSAPLGGSIKYDNRRKSYKAYSRSATEALDNFYKNNLWKKCLYRLRYLFSKVKILRRTVASGALCINYDTDTEKWLVRKVLI